MPPFIPSKRRLSTTSSPNGSTPKSAKKPSLFDTADKPDASATLQDNKAFLDRLGGPESESSLSDVSSADFEDALSPPNSKRRKISHHEEDEDEVDWEDAIKPTATPSTTVIAGPSGILELTLDKSARIGSITNPHDKNKGPSKIERQIRVSTHIMHVQFLLFHNLIRNGWACDKEVQRILVGQIPPRVNKEITRWKITAGMISGAAVEDARKTSGKTKEEKRRDRSERNQRDWGRPAEIQERGAPNMSRGDPTLKLLKVLAAYWKKRFTITAPSLRKQGYKSLAVLEAEIVSYRNDKHDPEEHGERIGSILDFRRLAKSCEGSRDVGAQLFTTLIRGLGIEARLVTSLQPIGFGWGQNEEASEERRNNTETRKIGDGDDASSPGEGSDSDIAPTVTKTSKKPRKSVGGNGRLRDARIVSIDLSEDSVKEDGDGIPPDDNDDDVSVIDVTPSTSRARPHMKYDRDMRFPTYVCTFSRRNPLIPGHSTG